MCLVEPKGLRKKSLKHWRKKKEEKSIRGSNQPGTRLVTARTFWDASKFRWNRKSWISGYLPVTKRRAVPILFFTVDLLCSGRSPLWDMLFLMAKAPIPFWRNAVRKSLDIIFWLSEFPLPKWSIFFLSLPTSLCNVIGKIEKFTPRGFKEGSPYLYLPFPTGNTRLAALSLTALPTKENIKSTQNKVDAVECLEVWHLRYRCPQVYLTASGLESVIQSLIQHKPLCLDQSVVIVLVCNPSRSSLLLTAFALRLGNPGKVCANWSLDYELTDSKLFHEISLACPTKEEQVMSYNSPTPFLFISVFSTST